MALWNDDTDYDLLSCPFDPVHQVCRKNFAKHLHKCRNNPENGGQPRAGLPQLVPCPGMCLTRHIQVCDLEAHLQKCLNFKKMVYNHLYRLPVLNELMKKT